MALTNNDILKSLRVALQLRDEDIIQILKLADYEIGKSELGAFFRKPDHPKFMPLKDQILRRFLNGLVIHKRGPLTPKPERTEKPKRKRISKPFAETPKKDSVTGEVKKRSFNKGAERTIKRRKNTEE